MICRSLVTGLIAGLALATQALNAHAMDVTYPTFDPAAGILKIPYLVEGNQRYAGVTIVIDENNTITDIRMEGTTLPAPSALPIRTYVSNFRGAGEGSILQLDNGQVWQVVSGSFTVPESTGGPAVLWLLGVTVYQGTNGTYYMTFEGRSTVLEVNPL